MVLIPDKMYLRIGEVSRILEVEPYVLRYWESEFQDIKPIRSNKQRLYRKKDVELILKIKKLLYEEGYTIAGAKQKVKKKDDEQISMKFSEQGYRKVLREVKEELYALKKILDAPR